MVIRQEKESSYNEDSGENAKNNTNCFSSAHLLQGGNAVATTDNNK